MGGHGSENGNDADCQQWSYYLDGNKKDCIMVKYVYSPNLDKIIRFVVAYHTVVNEIPCEVIRCDCSEKEAVHVHYFYRKPPEKEFVNAAADFATMEKFVDYITNNWQKLKSKFLS